MKKKIIISGSLVLAAILAVAIFSFLKKDQIEYATVELKRQNLVQTVSEIGTVRASKEIGLNFMQSGRLTKINFSVGDIVRAGDILAELDYSSSLIRKQEAEAAVSIALTNQQKIIKGAAATELAVLEAQVNQARSAQSAAWDNLAKSEQAVAENISQAERRLSDLRADNSQVPLVVKQAVESAKVNLDNVEKNTRQALEGSRGSLLSSLDYNLAVSKSSLDALNRILDDESLKNVFSVKNYSYKIETVKYYRQAVEKNPSVQVLVEAARNDPSQEKLKAASDELAVFLREIFSVLNSCFSALENSVTSSALSPAALDAFKANVNANRDLINGAISSNYNSFLSFDQAVLNYDTALSGARDTVAQAQANLSEAISAAANALSSAQVLGQQQLSQAQAQVDSAQKSYEVANSQLNRLKTAASSDDLRLAQAQVDQALASLDLVNRQIEDHLVKSPIDGRITKINYEIGEQVMNASPAINLLTDNEFEIEVFVTEADISKIKLGQEANITFDALGDDYQVRGWVYSIDPAATSISDVIYYKIKINFTEGEINQGDLIIKSGMTANVDITTNYKENVLVVPGRAVLSDENNESYLRVLANKKVRSIKVKVGLSGDQSLLEVISDELQVGDLIITSTSSK